jgi:hypothetical protein
MLAALGDDRFRAEDQPALRGADQLVGRAGDASTPARSARGSSAPRRSRTLRGRRRARSPRRTAAAGRVRARDLDSSAIDGVSVKPTISKFERCTRRIAAESEPRRRRSRGRASDSSCRPRAARAALLDDVGNAERAADLDQLAAGDDHLAPAATAAEQQQHVPRRCCWSGSPPRSRRAWAKRRQVLVARAALAGVEIEFEVRVAGGDGAARSQSAGAIGERPRFVWMMTPEPLMTRRSVDELDCGRARIASIASLSSMARARAGSARWAATAPFTRPRPNSAISGAIAALLRIRSTDGRPRSAELPVAGHAFRHQAYLSRAR